LLQDYSLQLHLVQVPPVHLVMFVFFRIIGGIGIGLASNLSPMYIAEITPGNVRGRFVSINQLTIVIGILAAQLINWRIARPVPAGATASDILASWNGQTGWRWMFYACTIPAGLFFLLMWFVPESPRWLAQKIEYQTKARKILAKIGGEEYAFRNLCQLKRHLTRQRKDKSQLAETTRYIKTTGSGYSVGSVSSNGAE
jgi:MFS family permease